MTTFVDAHRFDFNYNGGSGSLGADFLWRDHAGHDVVWLLFPFTVATLPTVPLGWHVKAAADFDGTVGTGNADILWQNDNGALALWQMEGATVAAVHALPNPGPTWHIVGDNNFFDSTNVLGDDILWRNDNGALAIWSGISAATGTITSMLAGTQNPGPAWHVVGTGDTNNDGISGDDSKAGILWQHNNGALVLWENPTLGAGTFTFNTVAALGTVDASWHVKGMADLNGDGTADIVFQHDSGAVVVWEMGGAAGTTVTAANLVDINPGPAWHIVGMRDRSVGFPAASDIWFQNDNGATAIWEHYQSFVPGSATFASVIPNPLDPDPNGHTWDLL